MQQQQLIVTNKQTHEGARVRVEYGFNSTCCFTGCVTRIDPFGDSFLCHKHQKEFYHEFSMKDLRTTKYLYYIDAIRSLRLVKKMGSDGIEGDRY